MRMVSPSMMTPGQCVQFGQSVAAILSIQLHPPSLLCGDTQGGLTPPVRTPGAKDAAHLGQHLFEVIGLLLEEGADVHAWRGPCATVCWI
jgi:hypothetical protein